jgi:FkbM family methyltransferase
MAKCSYAQNREDVLLARVFPETTGFYVDIGAADPVEHSVTKYFYDLGWSGINVEPQGDLHARLRAERPRDRNLRLAVSDADGTLVLHVAPTHPGFSTTDADVARAMVERGIEIVDVEVPTTTLAALLDEQTPPEITFLKIDVEGAEERVLAGADFDRFRPRVVLVEATEQSSETPRYVHWEHLLLDKGYLFATFDGLNRYYVRAEDAQLVATFQVPVNVFDDWYPYEYVRRIYELEQDRAVLDQIAGRLRALRSDLTDGGER